MYYDQQSRIYPAELPGKDDEPCKELQGLHRAELKRGVQRPISRQMR